MGKRFTPLERAINATESRKAKYDKRMRDMGYVRATIWVKEEWRADLRRILDQARKLNVATPDEFNSMVREMLGVEGAEGGERLQ